MIVQNFKAKASQGFAHSNIKGALGYLLDKKDRDPQAEILDGSRSRTMQIDATLCENFKHKYTSGVMSFKKGEVLTHQQKLEIIDRFKDVFLGNMKDNINCIFIEHTDKDRTEMHYIINKVDLETGKSFNPFPPGKKTVELMKAFSSEINKQYGFDDVKEKTTTKEKSKYGSLKMEIENKCKRLVKLGLVKNRNELIEHLKKDGYKIERTGNDYISISSDTKNIRLKGGIFSSETNYKNVNVDSKKTDLNKLVNERNNYNSERYNAPKNQPLKTAAIASNSTSQGTPTQQPQKPNQGAKNGLPAGLGKNGAPVTPGTTTPGPTPGTDLPPTPTANGGSAATRLQAATAKLVNAKTKGEEIAAALEVALAKRALEEEQHAEEEQRRKRINKI